MSKMTETEKLVLESIQELNIRLVDLENWKTDKIEQEERAMKYLEELAKCGDMK